MTSRLLSLPNGILVCPDCRSALDRSADGLRCGLCSAAFGDREGALCLWPPSRVARIEADLSRFATPHGQLRNNNALRALIPPNPVYDPYEKDRTWRIRSAMTGVVVNLGAKSAQWGEHVLSVDLVAPRAAAVDALADIHRLPFADRSVDGVICTYVLEHVADARECIAEIARIVKPGGQVFISVPFLFPNHPDPLDHARWTLQGLRADLSEFEEIEAGNAGGPFSTLAAVVPTAMGSMFSSFVPYNATRFALGWLYWPFKFLDFFAARSTRAGMAAPAFYFWGKRKP